MKRRTPLIGAVVAILLVAGWFVAFWQPAGHHLKKLQGAEAAVVAQHAVLQGDLLRLEQLRLTLPAKEAKLRSSLVALPLANSVDTVIDQINALAIADHITWSQESQALGTSATTTPITAPATASSTTTSTTTASTSAATVPAASSSGGPSTVALTLAISGSYSNVQDFIAGLLERPRLIVIQNLTYGPGGRSVSLAITATAFYDPTALPTVPASAG